MFPFASHFSQGLKYADFLSRRGTEEHRRRWKVVYDHVHLTAPQHEVLAGFVREMKVMCLTTWCGDCTNQGPIFQKFADAAPKIDLRFFERDLHPDLQSALKICGGERVPMVVFLSEDDQFLGLYGERTLSKYRQLAADQLGQSCPTGVTLPHQGLLDAVTQDWLNEFERIQLMLRLSGRLRQKHGD